MLDKYWGGWLNTWMIGCLMNWNVPKDEEKRTLKYFRWHSSKPAVSSKSDKESCRNGSHSDIVDYFTLISLFCPLPSLFRDN
jgi:hypothetical protein